MQTLTCVSFGSITHTAYGTVVRVWYRREQATMSDIERLPHAPICSKPTLNAPKRGLTCGPSLPAPSPASVSTRKREPLPPGDLNAAGIWPWPPTRS